MSDAAAAAGKQPNARELFVHRAHREGRPVVILRGVRVESEAGVTVEAEVYPVESGAPGQVLRRPYRFPTAEQATRFVEEALIALEYLDCSIA